MHALRSCLTRPGAANATRAILTARAAARQAVQFFQSQSRGVASIAFGCQLARFGHIDRGGLGPWGRDGRVGRTQLRDSGTLLPWPFSDNDRRRVLQVPPDPATAKPQLTEPPEPRPPTNIGRRNGSIPGRDRQNSVSSDSWMA